MSKAGHTDWLASLKTGLEEKKRKRHVTQKKKMNTQLEESRITYS